VAREEISMSSGEVLEFLGRQRWVVLGTLAAHGGPSAALVPCALEGESLYFGVTRDSEALANLERDPRACCANDEYPTYYGIKGVTLHGLAQRVGDPDLCRRLGLDRAGLEVFRLGTDDAFSFDFGKIRNKF
jgi:nitroimidazol reductase NimA-like FMN-containing flavoprotein (pyridoxamine 5'-phosphate oxidase superfamily)